MSLKILLDTHTFLWFLAGDPRISDQARALISSEENEVLISVVSLWEIAIKSSIGRLELTGSFDAVITSNLSRNSIAVSTWILCILRGLRPSRFIIATPSIERSSHRLSLKISRSSPSILHFALIR